MNLSDAIGLIKHPALTSGTQGTWADLGCGSGTFTFALAHLLKAGSTIYAWDKTFPVFAELKQPADLQINPGRLDFVKEDIPVSNLNGILMANSLHYVADKTILIHKLRRHLQPDGSFLVVEYETSRSNRWVPYPVPFQDLQKLFAAAGFGNGTKLQERPSLYGSGKMYAAFFCR